MSKPGEIAAWGDSASVEIKNVPPGDKFRMIAPGGHSQSLAIRVDGTLLLWGKGSVPDLTGNLLNDSFTDAALTPNLIIAIRTDNREIEIHGDFLQPGGVTAAMVPATLKKMKVMGVAAGGPHVVVIGFTDHLLYQFGPAPAPCPGGKFLQVRARHGYTIGLDDSGNLYGWGAYFGFPAPSPGTHELGPFPNFWESNPYVGDTVGWETRPAYSEPSWQRDSAGHWFVPGPFVDLAAGVRELGQTGLPHILALRPDGRVVGWGGNAFKQAEAPPGLKFLAIAAGKGFSVGIAKNSELHHWGQGGGPHKAPSAVFQSVSAAVAHAAAVRGTLQFIKKIK